MCKSFWFSSLKMVSATLKTEFDPVFDYSSAFQYHSLTRVPKCVNHNLYKSVFSYHSINVASDEDTDNVEDENWISSILRKVITFLFYAFTILSFPISFWISVKKVHALERIVLLRLGKMQPVRGPGFTLVLPVIDTWTRVNLRPQTFNVIPSQLLTTDGGIVEVQCEVRYQVSDIVSYVTKLRRQEKALRDLSLCCLTNVVAEKDQEDLENNREIVGNVLKHELNQATLKWGLEVLDVYLHSVKVLKPAEPVNALGTILTALKAATGHSTDHATAVFPLIPDGPLLKNPESPDVEMDVSVLDTLKKILATAEDRDLTRDVSGCFKLDILGNETNTLYCSFHKGHASIVENPNYPVESDVSLSMSEENARDFLSSKMSPLQAYMEGKVRVAGDWSLLRPLSRMLREPLIS